MTGRNMHFITKPEALLGLFLLITVALSWYIPFWLAFTFSVYWILLLFVLNILPWGFILYRRKNKYKTEKMTAAAIYSFFIGLSTFAILKFIFDGTVINIINPFLYLLSILAVLFTLLCLRRSNHCLMSDFISIFSISALSMSPIAMILAIGFAIGIS